ncbi:MULTISPECIES: efflux RND transporter periplasmic adaptor subunit [Methylococcus]|uniref:Membrane fusion protein, copper/silver efflux system n=1 Tax=Methylococcus capsulatus TaxID=414 RepID=A0AA35US13_METCP|nr:MULTISPECIES: efflux RND transporter periplasmic adaptor subunit [Methylococcus]UQN12437.1 efflux RND transporter periplasmic adaptor subunit [Methylococcus capsulatus]CAI8860684.1 membrane fusion protein, copper/silver efflux system [Methylococcus capsulatus]
MTFRYRDVLVGAVLGSVVTLALVLLFRADHPNLRQASPADGTEKPAQGDCGTAVELPATGEDHAGHVQTSTAPENSLVISPERLQSVGVKFEPAARRLLERTIRTVGRVEVDERQLSRVTVKLEGWIDRLLVNTTGASVRRGQVLFTLYSPELVATQEEYLIALRSIETLGESEFPEVAAGASALLEASRRRLLLWDIHESHIRDLERTGKVWTTLPIHAPRSGTVINKMAVEGLQTKPGDELYTIADLSRIWIMGDIYEYEMPLVSVGQVASVSLSYVPEVSLQARIGFIYPTVDPQTRTAKVRFELDNPGERLKPGMYANLELKIPLGMRLVVPKDAVLESGERQIIFIHLGGGRLEWRNARIGLRSGDWVEVLEGTREGEHVVTSANFLIDSESRLKSAVGGMPGMKH